MSDIRIEPLQIVGDPDAAVCEGEFCEIPAASAIPATPAESADR